MEIVKRKVQEVLTIESSMEDRSEVIDWVYRNGYSTSVSGPKPLGGFKVDVNVYQTVVFKEIDCPDLEEEEEDDPDAFDAEAYVKRC